MILLPSMNTIQKLSSVALALSCVAAARADLSNPPEYFGPVDASRAREHRVMICAPSLTVAANGRLWATWFTGPTPGEDTNNYVVLATSGDGGDTWKEVWCVDPDLKGPRRAFDPQVWAAPDGSLLWSWTDRDGAASVTDGLWLSRIADATSDAVAPAAPRVVAHGVMLGNPFVLADGTWGLPVCAWFSRNSSGLYVSSDKGATWRWRGGAGLAEYKDRTFDEHNIVPMKDGSLCCISRTKMKGVGIARAFSKDNGETWSGLKPFNVTNSSTRTFFTRLNSGNLLLVKNGPVDQDVGRKSLTAYLSKDEGETWEGGLLLDARGGATYPNGGQRPDGVIFLVNDHDRYGTQDIDLHCFTEEDVLAGKIVSKEGKLLRYVHTRPDRKGCSRKAKHVEAHTQPENL